METNHAGDPLLQTSLIDDYPWRFELIRSTLEDLDQLIEDKKPVSTTGPGSSLRAPTSQRDVPFPWLTLQRLRLAAMTA
jgi:hypothetical protein